MITGLAVAFLLTLDDCCGAGGWISTQRVTFCIASGSIILDFFGAFSTSASEFCPAFSSRFLFSLSQRFRLASSVFSRFFCNFSLTTINLASVESQCNPTYNNQRKKHTSWCQVIHNILKVFFECLFRGSIIFIYIVVIRVHGGKKYDIMAVARVVEGRERRISRFPKMEIDVRRARKKKTGISLQSETAVNSWRSVHRCF